MDLLNLIKERRSIRRYKERPVPREYIEQMIEAAIWAPSSHSSDPCEFIVTERPENIARLADRSHAKFIGGAPLVITIVVRPDTGTKSPIMDGSAAAMNLSLEAHALGLGCCWISPAPWAAKLRAELRIPEDWKVIGAFSIGFPEESRAGRRKAWETAVHWEHHGSQSIQPEQPRALGIGDRRSRIPGAMADAIRTTRWPRPCAVEFLAVAPFPNVSNGDALDAVIDRTIDAAGMSLCENDVLIVTHKIVSIAEGRVVSLDDTRVSTRAVDLAQATGKDPRVVEWILREARAIVRIAGHHIITEHKLGHVSANSSVDRSNAGAPTAFASFRRTPTAARGRLRRVSARAVEQRLACS